MKQIQQNNNKPREWKRYIDDVFSLWDCPKNEVGRIIEQANTFHPTIKFTAEISENKITFLDTVVFKGERSILNIKTHYKPTETFQYTHFTPCHPPGVKRGFIKGEAIRLLRTNNILSVLQTSNDASAKHAGIRRKYRKVPARGLFLNRKNKKNGRQTIVFCHFMPPCSKNHDGKLEFHRKSASAVNNF